MAELAEIIRSDNGRFRAEIYYDPDPQDPREWDNLGVLVTGARSAPFRGEEICEGDWAPPVGAIWLPVYVLEHSGVWVSTTPFNQPWDSWQGGVIYTTPERIRMFYGDNATSPEADIKRALAQEIETFNQFLQGDTYGFIICREEDDEELDSCWGYFGIDGIRSDVHNILEQYEETTPLHLTLPGVRVA